MDSEGFDKDWARRYILDPLSGPTPSQVCGIEGKPAYFLRSSSSESSDTAYSSDHKKKSKRAILLSQTRKLLGKSKCSGPPPSLPDELPTPPDSPSLDQASVSTDPSRRNHRQQCLRNGSSPRSSCSNKRATHQPRVQRRLSQLEPRYPGDMSHRPLDVIRAETRRAERGHRRGASSTDTDVIDGLDTIGGTYHHGGPYDATLAGRNRNLKYSPVAAVQASNEEALRATPQEFITDSLEQHVPLQGTGIIPPGGRDPRGRIMHYEEGADLMREADAPGGAYKRWDNIPYHPDDLKGKGEPSYTLERDLKQKDRFLNPSGDYELQTPRRSRHRSTSNVDQPAVASSSGSGVQRSHTVGKKLGDVRQRLHLKKKPVATEQEL